MFSSLRWPLALAIFSVIVLALGLVEFTLFREVRESYLKRTHEGLQQECNFIANLMRRPGHTGLMLSSLGLVILGLTIQETRRKAL